MNVLSFVSETFRQTAKISSRSCFKTIPPAELIKKTAISKNSEKGRETEREREGEGVSKQKYQPGEVPGASAIMPRGCP